MADKFNRNFDLDELIDSLPAGLDRALLRTLSAMQKSAERTWGRYSPARQPSLFG